MRRSVFRTQFAQATGHNPPRRTLIHSSPRWRPELAFSTSADVEPPPFGKETLPFKFETGLALFAKRKPRAFPPPFLSPPSGSFSDPLSTHHMSRDGRPSVNGKVIRGHTNGDDAVYASDYFIGANDGVGAWSTREGGHAGLWSRLILHFWALEIENDTRKSRIAGQYFEPSPVNCLQKAYEQTIEATASPNRWRGTTTATGAQLHYKNDELNPTAPATPLLYVTNIGDSQVLVIRPKQEGRIYKTTEQWHWFDCPRQLGTNSPDTPINNAILDKVEIEEDDVVLAMSDGVIDNLWEHEIIEIVVSSIRKWERGEVGTSTGDRKAGSGGGMKFVADEIMKAARVIAQDPFAESPYMERAVEEGLAMEGGKLDDISVVAALCKRCNGSSTLRAI